LRGILIPHIIRFWQTLNDLIIWVLQHQITETHANTIFYKLYILYPLDLGCCRFWRQTEWRTLKVMCTGCTLWDKTLSGNLGIFLTHLPSKFQTLCKLLTIVTLFPLFCFCLLSWLSDEYVVRVINQNFRYEGAFNRFVEEVNALATYQWWEGSMYSILFFLAYPLAWSWQQWRRKLKLQRLREFVRSEYDHACLRSCRSRALYEGLKVALLRNIYLNKVSKYCYYFSFIVPCLLNYIVLWF